MSEPRRISVDAARNLIRADDATLVCAYEDPKKCEKVRLDGAQSLVDFQEVASDLPRDRNIIFY